LARAIGELSKQARRLACALVFLFGRLQLSRNGALQSRVARQTKDIIDSVLLAPRHQLFPTEARIGTQNNAYLGPALANLFDDALDLFPATRAGILVGGSLPRAQQVIAAEDIQWQITVLVVVAVEKTIFL